MYVYPLDCWKTYSFQYVSRWERQVLVCGLLLKTPSSNIQPFVSLFFFYKSTKQDRKKEKYLLPSWVSLTRIFLFKRNKRFTPPQGAQYLGNDMRVKEKKCCAVIIIQDERDAVYRTLIVVLLFARKRPVLNLQFVQYTSRDHQPGENKYGKRERWKEKKNMSRTRGLHSTALVMDRW